MSSWMAMEYDFTLKFALAEGDSDAAAIVERLGASGCDDALVGTGIPGRIALSFTREAASAEDAVLSALADVKRAVPSARLIEAGPDFVGLTEVAGLVGMSRQNMRKLMLSHAASFPPPVHEGSASIWHLALVLQWLEDRGGYRVPAATLAVSRMAMQLNLARDSGLASARLRSQVRELV